MKPKTTEDPQNRIFQMRLENMINMEHELVLLSGKINWKAFEKKFGEVYIQDVGRPGLPTRLMVGLHYLKGLHDLSDEDVVEGFLENPYWQYFCGMEFFEHKLPLNSSSMTRWRKRVGSRGFETLLKETLETALLMNCLKQKDMLKVTIDTTVQEKNITFPTDVKLYAKGTEILVREAKKAGIELRQSYTRTVPMLQRENWLKNRGRRYKQAKACQRRLKTILGRTVRDITRKATEDQLTGKLGKYLSMAEQVLNQKQEDKNKIYSYFEPETSCIAKGKIHKKYEFGAKASIVTTQKGNWILGTTTYKGSPNDITTLSDSLDQVQQMTGCYPEEVYCDKGYRGKKVHEGLQCKVFIPGTGQKVTSAQKKRLKRRNAIEPVIGHLKEDHGMARNYLKGRMGDEINALMASCGFNLKKLLKSLRAFLSQIITSLILVYLKQNNKNQALQLGFI